MSVRNSLAKDFMGCPEEFDFIRKFPHFHKKYIKQRDDKVMLQCRKSPFEVAVLKGVRQERRPSGEFAKFSNL